MHFRIANWHFGVEMRRECEQLDLRVDAIAAVAQ
jgi:hypothetical protein